MNYTASIPAAMGAAIVAIAQIPASGANLCYGLRGNYTAVPHLWSYSANWLDIDNGNAQVNRQPTSGDNVRIWSNDLNLLNPNGYAPLVVDSSAVVNEFSLGYGAKNAGNIPVMEIRSGGSLTTDGTAILGHGSSTAAGGIVTVKSGGSWTANGAVYVGSSTFDGNLLVVESGGSVTQSAGEFRVGNTAGHVGTVTNRGTLAVYDIFPGGDNGIGKVVNEGDFTVNGKFTIGRREGSSGVFYQKAGSFTKNGTTQPVIVGSASRGVFSVDTALSLPNGDTVVIGNTATGDGEMVMGEGGAVSGLGTMIIGYNAAGARGSLTLAGGTVALNGISSGFNLYVGRLDNGAQTAWGTIRGYGKIGLSDWSDASVGVRLAPYGQFIAEGGDLDLGGIRTVGESGVAPNGCGTNGWYAVNGGRLVYPRRQNFGTADHVAVGEFVYRGTRDATDISLVNSLQVRLYSGDSQLADGNYNFAMLYAADRDDIPGAATLPGAGGSAGERTLGVWRIGHFSDTGDVGHAPQNPVAFDSATLRIRFDDAPLAGITDWSGLSIGLWRWDGSAWRRVGRADPAMAPYIETASRIPAYTADLNDNWNVGWFAVAVTRDNPFVIVVR